MSDRAPRLDAPRDLRRRRLVRRPAYDTDRFGVFAEQFARFMGTAQFLIYMTLFVAAWLAWNVLMPDRLVFDAPPFIALTLMLSLQASYAAPLRRLLAYSDDTAGGMMTTEPVILPPDATVADALAHVRNPELTPALAALVYVCRQPLECPTGKLIGIAHIQRLLREPPSTLVAGALDDSMENLRPEASLDEVAAHLATYNLVAAPVVDEDGHLLGAVTVDDLLDHMLPENWRDRAVRHG